MKLIFIHGRAQGGKDPLTLRKTWIDTFKSGLARSGLTLPIDETDILLPFYGDLLDQLVKEIDESVEEVIKKGAITNSSDARFFHDFLSQIATNAKITTQEIEQQNNAVITEKGPLNWEWVHCILRAIDQNGKWSETSIKKFTYDVFLYLTIPAIKEKIHREVLKAFDAEPCVVVGHSLGSIVSYNIIRDLSSPAINKFFTIGSPLGITAVKKHLKVPIKMPEIIKYGWYNAFDERDVVALNPLNKEFFEITPPVKNNNTIDNQTANRHGIEGYLNDKTLAGEIYSALTMNP